MTPQDFFFHTFGFREQDYETTQQLLLQQSQFSTVSETIPYYTESCNIQKRTGINTPCRICWSAGTFSLPTVTELHQHVQLLLHTDPIIQQLLLQQAAKATSIPTTKTTFLKTTLCNIVGEARALHQLEVVEGKVPSTIHEVSSSTTTTTTTTKTTAVIQVASQFNGLEFASPHVIPEQGIQGYVFDHTQGPVCAMACAAGTAYRNYLIPIQSFLPSSSSSSSSSSQQQQQQQQQQQRGQTADHQINTLVDMERVLQESCGMVPWKVHNGYVESDNLEVLHQWMSQQSEEQLTIWMRKLRIVVQADTSVTDVPFHDNDNNNNNNNNNNKRTTIPTVTQTYNAALSIGYSKLSKDAWSPLAQCILKATYEATLLVGIIQTLRSWKEQGYIHTIPIFLTKVGGGVFGNDSKWIVNAIQYAMNQMEQLYSMVPLDVRIVHYKDIDRTFIGLEQTENKKHNIKS